MRFAVCSSFIFVCVLTLSSSSFAQLAQISTVNSQAAPQQEGNAGSSITSLRSDDPRLQKRVTNALTNVYVGEVLEEWTRQTGVVFTARDTSGAANQRVNVLIRDVPLAEAMDALWSLMSFKQATYRWARSGKGEDSAPFVYEFIRPASAQILAQSLRDSINKTLDDDAEECAKLITMTPEELAAAAKTSRLARRLVAQPIIREGLKLFYSLPKERQAAVLTGKAFETIPYHKMDDAGKQFASAYLGKISAGSRAGEQPNIMFGSLRPNDGTFPVMTLQVLKVGGWNFLGGKTAENGFFDNIRFDWILRGDETITNKDALLGAKPAKRDSLIDRKNKMPPLKAPKGGWLALVYQELYEIDSTTLDGATAPFSLMALAEPTTNTRIDSTLLNPYGTRINAFTAAFNAFGLMTKWRGPVLLLRDEKWYGDQSAEDAPYWSVVKALRATKAGQKKADAKAPRYTLADFALIAASGMTEAQINVLADEFTGARAVGNETNRTMFRALAQDAPLLARLDRGEAVPLADVSPRVLKAMGMTNVAAGAVLRARSSAASPANSGASPEETWMFDAESGGKVLATHPFTYLYKPRGTADVP